MKNWYLYHGTSFESAKNIMKNGWTRRPENIGENWCASLPDCIYLASNEISDGLGFAVQAGISAAAIQGTLKESVCVLKLHVIDEATVSGKLDVDYSAENMEDFYEIKAEDLDELVFTGAISMECIEIKGYHPAFRPFYLASYIHNPYAVELETKLYKEVCFADSIDKDGNAFASLLEEIEFPEQEEIELEPELEENFL